MCDVGSSHVGETGLLESSSEHFEGVELRSGGDPITETSETKPQIAAHSTSSSSQCEESRYLPTVQEPVMDDEIQLISDGDGLAVLGDPAAVEGFLVSEGLQSKDLGLPRLGAVLSTGAAAAQAGSEIAANSGRWVKLTKESAQLVQKHGLRKTPRASTLVC